MPPGQTTIQGLGAEVATHPEEWKPQAAYGPGRGRLRLSVGHFRSRHSPGGAQGRCKRITCVLAFRGPSEISSLSGDGRLTGLFGDGGPKRPRPLRKFGGGAGASWCVWGGPPLVVIAAQRQVWPSARRSATARALRGPLTWRSRHRTSWANSRTIRRGARNYGRVRGRRRLDVLRRIRTYGSTAPFLKRGIGQFHPSL